MFDKLCDEEEYRYVVSCTRDKMIKYFPSPSLIICMYVNLFSTNILLFFKGEQGTQLTGTSRMNPRDSVKLLAVPFILVSVSLAAGRRWLVVIVVVLLLRAGRTQGFNLGRGAKR